MIRATILIASHRQELLPRALASAFNQDLPHDQLQILVNYSRDRDLFLTNWNDLCAIAKGEYVCILGDDDTLEPEYIRSCITALDTSGASIAYTDTYVRNADGELIETYRPPTPITLDTMREGNKLWQSSVVRRTWWQVVGGYDATIPWVLDYDFWVRCLQAGARTEYVPMIGWNYYEHDIDRITTSVNTQDALAVFDSKHPGFRLTR